MHEVTKLTSDGMDLVQKRLTEKKTDDSQRRPIVPYHCPTMRLTDLGWGLLCGVTLVALATSLQAEQTPTTQSTTENTAEAGPVHIVLDSEPGSRNYGRPYCGLYCLYAAMLLEERPVEFVDLLKPEYLSRRNGSSLRELERAARDHGMHAVVVGQLTVDSLRDAPYPMVLHVKSDAESTDYDHYELFLGAEDGRARLLNPPKETRWVDYDELALRWSGNALVLSSEPIEMAAVVGRTRNRFAVYLLVGGLVVLGVHQARKRWSRPTVTTTRGFVAVSMRHAVGVSLAATAVGLIYHSRGYAGLLAHPQATAAIQRAHYSAIVPKVSLGTVKRLMRTGAVIVDARYTRDFNLGHLEGARNIPVYADKEQRQAEMAGVSKDARIVVYCQSKGCPYAAKVAAALEQDDFRHVSVFKGGWQEWSAETAAGQ